MTYGPTEEGKITLNKLNELIAKEKGVKVSELAVEDDTPKAEAPAKKTAKKTARDERTRARDRSLRTGSRVHVLSATVYMSGFSES